MIEYLRNNLYDILSHLLEVIILGSVLFTAVIIWALLKRWFLKAKIRREGKDFKDAYEHIHETKKGLNKLQRFLQGQTGVIVDKHIILQFVLPIGVGAIFWAVLRYYTAEIAFSEKFEIIALIIGAIASFPFLCNSIYKLIKHARIIPFVFWTVCFSWYVYLIYLHFAKHLPH